MNFKSILKFSSLLLFATPCVASFKGDCNTLNKELETNTKLYLRKHETSEEFQALKECSTTSDGDIKELYLVSQRIDQSAVEKALSNPSIKKLTYFVDDVFYQHDPAEYDDFPTSIAELSNLEDLTLKYNLKEFVHGEYFYMEKKIDKKVLKLTSKNIKSLTLDHITITKDIVDEISKLSSLEYLVVETGRDKNYKPTHDKYYQMLKDLKNISTLTIDGKTYNVENGKLLSQYTDECKEIQISLLKNIIPNLRKYERVNEFKPLKQCKVNEAGKVKEIYLVSARNDQSEIEKALDRESITKMTYLLDNDFYQHEPAVFNAYPTFLSKLINLRSLTFKYNLVRFDHGEYPTVEREISNAELKVHTYSKKIKYLTLEHIKITRGIVKEISRMSNLKSLTIISANDADKKYYYKLKELKNITSLTIDGKKII